MHIRQHQKASESGLLIIQILLHPIVEAYYVENKIMQRFTRSHQGTNISYTKMHYLQFISHSCQNFLPDSWTPVPQLLYLSFFTVYLISYIFFTICRRLLMAPLLTRPGCPSCDLLNISPSPSLSPCRKD